jgi:hypothetical protein
VSETLQADWAFAVVRLGLSDEEFGTLTRRELFVLGHEYEKLQEWKIELASRQTARLIAAFANIHRDKKQHPNPYSEDEFMPKPRQTEPQPWAEQLSIFVAMGMEMPGKN